MKKKIIILKDFHIFGICLSGVLVSVWAGLSVGSLLVGGLNFLFLGFAVKV